MSNERTLRWWELSADAKEIQDNKWQLSVAKTVATSGQVARSSNVIWKCAELSPITSINWNADYALDWSAHMPDPSFPVTIAGIWQPCAKGQVFDISSFGYWQQSSEPSEPGWLKVGKVDYVDPNTHELHIVVGLKSADSGTYEPIFIDPALIPLHAGGTYQPQEEVIWWLGSPATSGAVYDQFTGPSTQKDLTNPSPRTRKYEWWTTFTFTPKQTWITSDTGPAETDSAAICLSHGP